MPEPEVAVVIPTWGRETRLAFALEALEAQTLGRDRFEVVVVRPEQSEAEPTTEPPPGLRVREMLSGRPGTATQRNVGWRASAAPLIAFTDDDCRPSPGWLEALLRDAGTGDDVVQGRTEPDPDERHLMHGLARTIRNEHASGWYETCNIAYPRRLLERLDGFDEAIAFLGEDADLGARAVKSGAAVRFCDEALVWHAVHWRSLPAAVRDAVRRGSRPALVARHPELRASLWLGVFADRDHARTLLAGIGLLLARRSPLLGALAVLPYLRHRLDISGLRPWRLLRMPSQLATRAVVDFTELAAFAVSAARSRALVL